MSAAGGCLCGAVRYRTDAPLRPVIACHCTQCRKTSGHYAAATSALRARVTIEGRVAWYASSPCARRGFCPICGSNLFWDGPGTHLAIFAGTIDGDPGVRLAGHIFCAYKGTYYDIEGDLPRADGADPSMTTQVE
ncbi:hypothetical protein C8N32_10632 [Rhodovulum imhoffii]|uniref:CENP-V/GFA domain-containing protein n=1 Tax=Rhodovulum imhoffii TaxID=365340 RepID=A0A2T5BSV7_9RHOB|nr:GFA family protein [Rhodovulum imhoffii]MBK5935002.1 aldehyde-activating protein [Rhodovulum imhoffii]PTN02461.1 hypothetical protein C8N32_10632 [Rhodovulum imhoffii]